MYGFKFMFPTWPHKNIYFHVLILISLQKKEITSIIHLIQNIKIDFDNFNSSLLYLREFFDYVESFGKH